MQGSAKLIFLCGKMAAGKSTLARELAERERAAEAAERARKRGLKYREPLPAGHDAMITQPGELARLLVESCTEEGSR